MILRRNSKQRKLHTQHRLPLSGMQRREHPHGAEQEPNRLPLLGVQHQLDWHGNDSDYPSQHEMTAAAIVITYPQPFVPSPSMDE